MSHRKKPLSNLSKYIFLRARFFQVSLFYSIWITIITVTMPGVLKTLNQGDRRWRKYQELWVCQGSHGPRHMEVCLKKQWDLGNLGNCTKKNNKFNIIAFIIYSFFVWLFHFKHADFHSMNPVYYLCHSIIPGWDSVSFARIPIVL